MKSTSYVIDLSRLNRTEVIDYLRFVDPVTGYAALATLAETLSHISTPLPEWVTRKLQYAGLLGAHGLSYCIPAPVPEQPFGALAGYPLTADDRAPIWHDADIAPLHTLSASTFFKSKVPGTKRDHMMPFRASLEILGLPLPLWAARKSYRGRIMPGRFTCRADYPSAPVNELAPNSDELADLLGLDAHYPERRAAIAA